MSEEKQINLKVNISRTARGFTLIYDGVENYYLFYDNEEIGSIVSDLTPKQLYEEHFNNKNHTTSEVFNDIDNYKTNENKELSPLSKMILNEFKDRLLQTERGKKADNTYRKNQFDEVIRTLKDVYTAKDIDKRNYIDYFLNAPSEVKSKALELSELYDNRNANQYEVYSYNENNLSIDEQIEERANPTLTKEQREIIKQIKKEITEKGLIDYLNYILDAVQVGEHKNVLRKVLSQFGIMRGKASYLVEDVARAGGGKSYENKIVYEYITPARYVYKLSDVTEASFIRYSQMSEYYFNRQTILFGDFGSKNSFGKIEPVFNIIKELITEKEYTGSKARKNDDDWESNELNLKVESIGGAYSTTLNSFTADDNQLISRTLNSTPAPVEEKEVITHLFYTAFSQSKQSKDKEKAIAKLNEFGLYLMSLVTLDVEIINPYLDVFLEYALKSENPIREYEQQQELFISYCELTIHECEKVGNYTVASLKQLTDYMNKINLENALIPYENDFLKMIMAKGNKHELKIVVDLTEEEIKERIKDIEEKEFLPDVKEELINKHERILNKMENGELITITECENNTIEFVSDYAEVKADLKPSEIKQGLPLKLNMLYGLRGRNSNHKGRVFFRISDLRDVHGRKKAFKNIDNLSNLLNSLMNKGYLGKYQYKIDGENLYYLTSMCDDIMTQFKPLKTFKQYWNEFSTNAGLTDDKI